MSTQNTPSPKIEIIKTALYGHTSEETAYVIEDYPYGRLRTKMKVWVEYRPKFGFRIMHQTLNPKNGYWNKPKAGNYYNLVIMVKQNVDLDGKEHKDFITFDSLSFYSDTKHFQEIKKLDLLGIVKRNADGSRAATAQECVEVLEKYSRKTNPNMWVAFDAQIWK